MVIEGALKFRRQTSPDRVPDTDCGARGNIPGSLLRAIRGRLTLIDEEKFVWDWLPIAPPPDGYPYDHVRNDRAPVNYHWLQTTTQYGWLGTLSTDCGGRIEFKLMTPDIQRVCYPPGRGRWHVRSGATAACRDFEKKFIVTGASTQYGNIFDRPIPRDAHIYFDHPTPEPNTAYAIRVVWDERGYRAWVNGLPWKRQGRQSFHSSTHIAPSVTWIRSLPLDCTACVFR